MSENRTRIATFLVLAQICGAALVLAPSAAAQETRNPEKLTPGSFKAYAGDGADVRVSNFSGQPVPRYASLRSDNVNGRAGPSVDYPVEWKYERAGLPVIVVRESQDWRKIRDPMGDEVWVNKSLLAGERTAITIDSGEIRKEANAGSAAVARFGAGAVMSLSECRADWCRVEAEGRKGWVLKDHLWGVEALPAPDSVPGNH